jgi:hypothetical protein
MKRLLLVLFWLILSLPVFAQATTRYVIPSAGGTGCSNGSTNYHVGSNTCSGGADQVVYTTILNGLNAMNACDTLTIRGGNYTEKLDVTGFTWPCSSYNSPTLIQGQPGETVTLTPASPDATIHTNAEGTWPAIAQTYIIFKHIKIDARNLNPHFGNSATSISHFTRFDDIDICCVGDNAGTNRISGIGVQVGDDVEIINSNIHDYGLNFFQPFNYTQADIDNGTALGGFGFYGVYWGGANGVLRNTTFSNIGAFCIHQYSFTHVSGLDNFLVEGNTFKNCGGYMYNSPASGTPPGFIFPGQKASTVAILTSGHNAIFRNNLLNGNLFGEGVVVTFFSSGFQIYNNTIRGMSTSGIFVDGGPTNLSIHDNIVVDNGINFSNGDNPGTPTYTRNLCSAAGGTPSPQCTGSLTELSSATFVNNTNDFHLKAGSKARNAIPLGQCLTSVDVTGLARPQENLCDIGAYEFASASNVPPTITIGAIAGLSSCTTVGSVTTCNTGNSTIIPLGTATDSDGTISSVAYTCNRCGASSGAGSGSASLTLPNWTIGTIPVPIQLHAGINTLIITATDNGGAATARTLVVNYTPTFPGNTMALGLACDEGSGTTCADSSGNGNTATLISGATWTTSGRFGKGVVLDDALHQYINVPDSNSLDFTQSFTLSLWAFPTASMTGFNALITKGDALQRLYASASSDSCSVTGNGSPFGIFKTNGILGPDFQVCGTPPLAINQWSYVALTYNGSVLSLWVNGVLANSISGAGLMEPSALPWQIGASQFGEYFKGVVDEVRLYNYAIPRFSGVQNAAGIGGACIAGTIPGSPTAGNIYFLDPPSIVRDMACGITPGAPPLAIKIPASATGLKLSGVVKFGSR